MSEILNNIDRFLLFIAVVKYISSRVCSHVFATVLLNTFWRLWNWFFDVKFCWNHLIFTYFYPKISSFHNSVMISRRKLPDLSLNNIFSVLSIGLQYTLSFKWPDFGLKCRVTVMPKTKSLTLISLWGETDPWYILLTF